MKKYVLISLLVCSNAVSANWDNPNAPFPTKENVGETVLITWKTVDNVQKVCQDEYKSRGFGGFNYKVDACSFWNFATRTCTIYTKKNPTLHDVGHEIRHCYQGSWH
jgi:hypothetical protein